MQNLVTRFIKDESGATAIEYGLIAALISVALIAGAKAIGDGLNTKFGEVSNAVTSSTTNTGTAP
jgi:pilus assembly protein Flp/PilA